MQKKNNVKFGTIGCFVIGLILYLVGLYFLLCSKFNILWINKFIELDINFKVWGIILFTIGFVVFMIAIIFLYKDDHIKDTNRELIIEGKADVITIMVMTYLMMFMLIICLIFDEMIGALLFGVTVLIQSLLNSFLVRYFSKYGK